MSDNNFKLEQVQTDLMIGVFFQPYSGIPARYQH
jgi:hypothetical protein